MPFPYVAFLLLLTGFLSQCSPPTSKSVDASSAEVTTDSTTVPPPPTAAPTAQQATSLPDYGWPKDERVEMTEEALGGLCANKYGCLQEQLYPLGWSENGKFAYLIERAQEAVNDFTLVLFIQDMGTNEILVENTFKASAQKGYSESTSKYTVQEVWTAQAAMYNRLLQEHSIRSANGTQFYPSNEVTYQQRRFRIGRSSQMARQELFDVDVLTQLNVSITSDGSPSKILRQHKFGKYDMVLASTTAGYFSSLDGRFVAIVDAWEKRGFEGPPNVLKINIIGCDLGVESR